MVRKEDEVEEGDPKRSGKRGEAIPRCYDAALQERAAKVKSELNDTWNKKEHKGRKCPVKRAARKEEPAEDEQQERNRLYEAGTQVMQNLPLRERAYGILSHPPRFVGNRAENPSVDLRASA